MKSKYLFLILPLSLGACANDGGFLKPTTTITKVGDVNSPRADVNATYTPGRLSLATPKLISLSDMQNMKPHGDPVAEASSTDKLRGPAVRDAALSYGARGGLAWASAQINQMLEARASELSKTYNFSSFLIRQPNGGVTLLPPVISESMNTYEQADAGRTLRVADKYYEIIQQARFAPVAPLWHTYLVRSYSAPEAPQDELLPKNDGERDLWKKFVAEGWAKGVEQSRDIFQQDLNRLERDYTGMIRYSALLEQGQVTAPVVSGQALGVTGTGQDMRENDRLYRITQDPRLNVQRPSEWQSSPSSLTPSEAGTPPQ